MKIQAKRLLVGAVAVFLLLCGSAAVLSYSITKLEMCGNTIIEEISSPDDTMRAVIFERDCGATTGFSTQVSVLPRGAALPNEPGNLFAIGGKIAFPGKGGGPRISAKWRSGNAIALVYDTTAKVYLKNERVGYVSAFYQGFY